MAIYKKKSLLSVDLVCGCEGRKTNYVLMCIPPASTLF